MRGGTPLLLACCGGTALHFGGESLATSPGLGIIDTHQQQHFNTSSRHIFNTNTHHHLWAGLQHVQCCWVQRESVATSLGGFQPFTSPSSSTSSSSAFVILLFLLLLFDHLLTLHHRHGTSNTTHILGRARHILGTARHNIICGRAFRQLGNLSCRVQRESLLMRSDLLGRVLQVGTPGGQLRVLGVLLLVICQSDRNLRGVVFPLVTQRDDCGGAVWDLCVLGTSPRSSPRAKSNPG